MGTTNGLSLPYPELTDSADGPTALSNLANAVEDYVYDRLLPGTVTHYAPHHWGTGASLPTSTQGARAGDLYYHSGLACTMRCITPGNTTPTNIWRQAEDAIVANAAARDAISANYSGLLYEGFRVIVQPVTGPPALPGQTNRWSGGAWSSSSTGMARLFAYASVARTAFAAGWQDLDLNVGTIDTHSAHTTGAALVNGQRFFTVPSGQTGRYAVEGGCVFAAAAAGSTINARVMKNSATFVGCVGTNVGHTGISGASAVTGLKLLDLTAGDTVHIQGTCSVTWSTAIFTDAAPWMSVMRID